MTKAKAKKKTKLKKTKAIRSLRIPKDVEPLDMANIAAPIGKPSEPPKHPPTHLDILIADIRQHLEKVMMHGGQAGIAENVVLSVLWNNNHGATYQSFYNRGFDTNAQKLQLIGQLEMLKQQNIESISGK